MNEESRPREFSYRIFLPQFFAATTKNELTFCTKLSQSGELDAILRQQHSTCDF